MAGLEGRPGADALLERLGLDPRVTRVVVDGPEHELEARLVEAVGDGRDALVVLPDEADRAGRLRGRAGRRAAARTGARLFRYADGRWHDVPPDDDALELLHAERADPWATTTRWYEQRKRALTLAALPRPRFGRALDVGCSTGTLTAELAGRCDAVVAVDRSATAVARARERLAGVPGVEVERLAVPEEWPDGRFDLVVVSESGYFLSPAGLDRLVVRVADALTTTGVVLLAHWRHPVVGWPLSGPQVHARFRSADRLPPVVASYVDRDVEILVLADEDALPEPTATR